MENRINTLFYHEDKIIRLNMVRKENRYGWCYGSLYQGENHICDTLEVYNPKDMPLGEFFLRSAIDTISGKEYIAVENESGDEITQILWQNTRYTGNIEHRIIESHIAVGSRINEPNLVTREYLFNLLKRFVNSTIISGKRVILTISNYENLKNYEGSQNFKDLKN